MANTIIQLKYSTVTNTPASLNVAEPAYSYSSNTLFIGTADSASALPIGGYNTYAAVNDATDANTASKIVKRASDGGFSATYVRASLFGNANTATVLQNGRNFNIEGEDVTSGFVGFDGSSAITLQGNLKTTGVSAGTYGGSANVPVFTVDTKGRLSYAGNVAISTSFGIAGDTGTGTVAGGETLTIVGRDGISTVAVDGNNSILVDVDNTVVRTTGGTISGDLSVTGNLVVSGNTITQDVETIVTEDSLIELAANNVADGLDIGLFGTYVSGGTKYTAFVRDASDSGKYKLLTAGTEKPSAANTVNVDAFSTATLVSNVEAPGSILIKNINVLDQANGAYNTANSASTNAADAYAKANGAFDKANSAFDIAGLAFNKANSAFDVAGLAYDKANGAAYVANTDYTNVSITAGHFGEVTGGYAFIPAFRVEANGRVSQANSTLLQVDASAINSGIFSVARGGTGANTFTTNGVLLGQGTGAFTTASSSTEGHILTINASGVPTFAHLQGGTF